MANDAFMKPEVPDSFRDLMKVSIEQAKRAFDTFAATSEKTWKTFETSSQTASSGLRSRAIELFDQGSLVAGVQMSCTLLSLLSG